MHTDIADQNILADESHAHVRQLVRHGQSIRLGVPPDMLQTYLVERTEIGRPPVSDAERFEVMSFYRQRKGYQLDWGQVIEEGSGGQLTLHIVPTSLIEAGAKLRSLNYVAKEWYELFEPVLRGMIHVVDGPQFIPLSIRCEHELAREWIAEVFLKTYLPSLMHTWETRLSLDQAANHESTDAGRVEPEEKLSVVLIYRPPARTSGRCPSETVHAILVSVEEPPRMCFTSFSEENGLFTTSWLPLPPARDAFEVQPVDFIVDFHKEVGAITVDLRIASDLSTVPFLVQSLLRAVRNGASEEELRRILVSTAAQHH